MDAKFVLKIFTVLFDNAEFLSFGSFSFLSYSVAINGVAASACA